MARQDLEEEVRVRRGSCLAKYLRSSARERNIFDVFRFAWFLEALPSTRAQVIVELLRVRCNDELNQTCSGGVERHANELD